jgi:hypothetical protein
MPVLQGQSAPLYSGSHRRRSGQQREPGDVAWAYGGEVFAIHCGNLGRSMEFGACDHRGIDHAERQVKALRPELPRCGASRRVHGLSDQGLSARS